MARTKKRSPLKGKPLRYPGQSLDERRLYLVWNNLLVPLAVAGIAVLFALMEVLRHAVGFRPPPALFVVAAGAGVLYAVYKIGSAAPELRSIQLARDGERAVGQYLEGLRERGYRVLHDVGGGTFNIDHVLLGPTGIYTIETKTRSKAAGPDVKVRFNGEEVLVDGYQSDRDPVIQARAQARWLRELLRESTGKDFPVRPVILFPGWFIEQSPGAMKELWVLNPKALPEFLKNEKSRLTDEDVKLASFHLSRCVRAAQA